jgi:hypothetical protein
MAESPANLCSPAPRRPSDARVAGVVWVGGRCYRLCVMRAVLSALLAFVVVFQSSWALAAPYCQHERTNASVHFGHHEHEHEHDHAVPSAAASGDTGDDSAAQAPAGVHADCSACHASSPAIVLPMAHALTDPRQSEPVTRVPTASPEGLAASIERPNWPALA